MRERVRASFDNFKRKMEFLLRFGNFLYLHRNIGEVSSMMHYIVMKKTYLLTKAFKEHYVSLKRNADPHPCFQAFDDFLKGVERESLTHLISFQNVLSNSVDAGKLAELSRDLESLDNFAHFDALRVSVIQPLLNIPKELSIDKLCTELCMTFVENERSHSFADFGKELTVPDT